MLATRAPGPGSSSRQLPLAIKQPRWRRISQPSHPMQGTRSCAGGQHVVLDRRQLASRGSAGAATADPIAQQVAASFPIERPSDSTSRHSPRTALLRIDRGELFERPPRFLQMLAWIGWRCQCRCGPAFAQRRDDLLAEEIAIEREIVVGRIGQPRQSFRPRPRLEFSAREIQQRSHQPAVCERLRRRHRAQPGKTRAAHQREQHRFQLIVGVVGTEQIFAGS